MATVTTYDVPVVSNRNALRPTSGLIWDCVRAMLVGHSTSELIQAGCNKFPTSTCLRPLKPDSPQQREQYVRVKSHCGSFPHMSSENSYRCL